MKQLPTTLGALRRTAAGRSAARGLGVKDEIRANLRNLLGSQRPVFRSLIGYDDTVIPQVVNALLSRHNFILLGLRGQAKSRLLRELPALLDPVIPIVEGSEVNDNPFHPVSKYARDLVANAGADTPIAWMERDRRFIEKLATPDVTIADLIGDVDPIRAAKGGHILSDELSINFGLLPRANRGIFALNELPDLSAKVQVGLFNIMQEGDIQIKGYPVRLPLDILLCFTANPEDYTARGKIITPLKDRIGSEIRTHYPTDVGEAARITLNESWTTRLNSDANVPHIVRILVECVAFEARKDRRIDQRAGVSQRLSITLLENALSNAERRAFTVGENRPIVRLGDVFASIPSITGKLELEYEGELVGGTTIAAELIARAASGICSEVDLLPNDAAVAWFDEGNAIQLSDMATSDACLALLSQVPGLLRNAELFCEELEEGAESHVVAAEIILESLVAQRKISRAGDTFQRGQEPRRRTRRSGADEQGSV